MGEGAGDHLTDMGTGAGPPQQGRGRDAQEEPADRGAVPLPPLCPLLREGHHPHEGPSCPQVAAATSLAAPPPAPGPCPSPGCPGAALEPPAGAQPPAWPAPAFRSPGAALYGQVLLGARLGGAWGRGVAGSPAWRLGSIPAGGWPPGGACCRSGGFLLFFILFFASNKGAPTHHSQSRTAGAAGLGIPE